MFNTIPAEITFAGLLFPPILIPVTGGIAGSLLTKIVMNKAGLMKWFRHQHLAVTSLAAIYASLLSLFFVRP